MAGMLIVHIRHQIDFLIDAATVRFEIPLRKDPEDGLLRERFSTAPSQLTSFLPSIQCLCFAV